MIASILRLCNGQPAPISRLSDPYFGGKDNFDKEHDYKPNIHFMDDCEPKSLSLRFSLYCFLEPDVLRLILTYLM